MDPAHKAQDVVKINIYVQKLDIFSESQSIILLTKKDLGVNFLNRMHWDNYESN